MYGLAGTYDLQSAYAELKQMKAFLERWETQKSDYDSLWGYGHWKAHHEITLSKINYLENELIPNLESGNQTWNHVKI